MGGEKWIFKKCRFIDEYVCVCVLQAEGEVNATRADITRLENARRSHEQETSLSEQRRQAIESEYEMYLRKEQLRMDFVQEAQNMHAQVFCARAPLPARTCELACTVYLLFGTG